MAIQQAQQSRDLAEEIRSISSQPPAPATVLLQEALTCKKTALLSVAFAHAVREGTPGNQRDTEYESRAILPAFQPLMI
jgi:hypothetical protein